MQTEIFEAVTRTMAEGGARPAAETLIERLKEERNYPGVFEARLMLARFEMGLPLIPDDSLQQLEGARRADYEKAQVEAAREVGSLFLADGDIYRAWPYLRAIGEAQQVKEAIANFRPAEDDERVDGIVEIAYHEGLNPRKGFELILERYGICRAITNFSQYPSEEGRVESGRLLVDELSRELGEGLKRAIERQEGSAPDTDSIAALIEGRDWLFEGASYYVDTSHVASVVQMSLDWTDEATLRRVWELTEYGRRLDEMYQFPGEAPFENVYEDYGVYLRALLSDGVDEAVEHFREKIPSEPDPYGNVPAQVLVRLLLRLGRTAEALEAAMEHLSDVPPQRLACPSIPQLCEMAGAPERLEEFARRTDDPLSFFAAALRKNSA